MKFQDIFFILLLMILLWRRNPKWMVWAGLACLVVSMPLFHFWIFFTAERLAYYAVGFLFVAVCLLLSKNR